MAPQTNALERAVVDPLRASLGGRVLREAAACSRVAALATGQTRWVPLSDLREGSVSRGLGAGLIELFGVPLTPWRHRKSD
jgi:hypothetical protein